jgi:uncharacterized protein (DUF58 family)
VRVTLVVILIFFALFFPDWGLQAISVFLATAVVLAWIYARLVERSLRAVRQQTVLRGHRHERISIRIRFENRGPLPVHFFLGRDHDAGLAIGATHLFQGLGPWQRRDFAYPIESSRRGEFELGPVTMRGADPLGLFRWEKRVRETMRVIIYPRVHQISLPTDRGLPAGNLPTADRIYEDVTRYRSLREYIPGDDIRRINWKASAKLGSLHTVEYLPALFFPVLILLNLSVEDYRERNRYYLVERSIETAASLISFFSSLDQEIGIVSTGVLDNEEVFVPVKGGTGQAVTLLEVLARIAPGRGTALYSAQVYGRNIKLNAGGRICVVGPPPNQEQRSFLTSARRKGYNVELFLVGAGAETSRQYRGVRCFRVREYGEELLERV